MSEHKTGGFGLPKLRKAALDRLAQAYADDDLDLDEFERRTTRANEARTVDEVLAIMQDIPDFQARYQLTRGQGGHSPVAGGYRTTELDSYATEETETRVQILGDQHYELADMPAGSLRVVSVLGDTTVNLTRLSPGSTVRLGGFSVLGDLTVIVPKGTRISSKQISILGDIEYTRKKKLKGRIADIVFGARMRREKSGNGSEAIPEPARVILAGFKLLGDTVIVEV